MHVLTALRRHSLIVLLALAIQPFVGVSVAKADSAFANIDITRYTKEASGGAHIEADYTLDPDSLCPCLPENIRWLQSIHLTDPTTGNDKIVNGYPNATFIDPQQTQPGGPFDNQPWYDYTYPTAADRTAGTNQGNGAGAFFVDVPSGWNPFAPISFQADTLLVCIDAATKTATFLGGFSWGFTVTNPGPTTTLLSITALSDSAALRSRFNDGAAGLATSYGWTLAADADPDACPVTVTVPVPQSLPAGLALCCIVAVPVARRRLAA